MITNSFDDLLIEHSANIRMAMALLDQNTRGILFVTHDQKLIGVVTDGDIRRALLAGLNLDSSIRGAMNQRYISLPVGSDNSLIRKTFKNDLKMIPLCDDSGKIVDVADVKRSHRIPVLEPVLKGRELEYVTDCLESNWISSQGTYVYSFEKHFERMHPGRYALAVSNGTVALHLALFALGIGKGDEVIVPDITFAATINAVLYCNATPVLCEIDAKTLCIDVYEAEKLITNRTKAIVPVHLYGQPCHMGLIENISRKHNLFVIEDCAEAIGSSWEGRPVGVFGDAATFSFFGNKTISTGEGGMILFQNKDVFERAKLLRDHGMNPQKKYWHDQIGFNYRLTNIQAAIGVAQMERLNLIVQRKIQIGLEYTRRLADTPGILMLPQAINSAVHSNWLYTIILEPHIDRDHLIRDLFELGIESRPVFYPLHTMPPYKSFKTSSSLVKSRSISRSGLSLPTSVSLEPDDIEYICRGLRKALLKLES